MKRSHNMLPMSLVWATLLLSSPQSGVFAAVMIAEFEVSDQADRQRVMSGGQPDAVPSSKSPTVRSTSGAEGSAGSGSQSSARTRATGSSSASSNSSGGGGGGHRGFQTATRQPAPATQPLVVGGSFFDGVQTDPIAHIAAPSQTSDLGLGAAISSLPPVFTIESKGFSEAANQSDFGDPGVLQSAGLSSAAAASAPEASAVVVWGLLSITALVGGIVRGRQIG